ncbi:uncharacterized protein ACB058_002572 [Synchiropus picturatus]
MDGQQNSVSGSVLIVHRLQDGKHQYEVGHVNYKKPGNGRQFVRGEQLMQINRMDLKDISPEELANTIADGNLMLTVHGSKSKEPLERTCPGKDALHMVSRDTMLLSFSMDMMRAGDLGQEEDEGEDDTCHMEDEEKEVLVVSMKNTSISVLSGRGNDHQFCGDCSGRGCTVHDMVVTAESNTVTIVSRGNASYRLEKQSEASVEHVATQDFLRSLCAHQMVYLSPDPERMTIYYYKSSVPDKHFRGVPVVLNFTGSNCFLRCCKEGGTVRLQTEAFEKQKLMQISRSDEASMSFVFCMKSNGMRQLTFESAPYPGWFIKIVDTESVDVGTVDGRQEPLLFRIIIQK